MNFYELLRKRKKKKRKEGHSSVGEKKSSWRRIAGVYRHPKKEGRFTIEKGSGKVFSSRKEEHFFPSACSLFFSSLGFLSPSYQLIRHVLDEVSRCLNKPSAPSSRVSTLSRLQRLPLHNATKERKKERDRKKRRKETLSCSVSGELFRVDIMRIENRTS